MLRTFVKTGRAEIREMIEPNLIYEPRNVQAANQTRDWKNPNDIQSLFRATEGKYSGDLKSGLVRISNGGKEVGLQMVQILNGICMV